MVRPSLPRYRGYLFDLDGTVYLGEELLPGARETIQALRDRGARVLFLSNNPLRPPRAYAEKLTRLGLPTRPEEVLTSLEATVLLLRRRLPGAAVFVLGEAPLRWALHRAGQPLTHDPTRAEVLLVSFDRTLTYERLTAAFRALQAGARLWATNPDPFCPTPEGGIPDAGATLAFLEALTGRRPEVVAGKPSEAFGRLALERLGLGPEEVLVVGDRLTTDVALGRAIGAATALVLTGATPRRALEAASVRPDHVLEGLADLPS